MLKTLIALGLGTVIGAILTFILMYSKAMISGGESKELTKEEWKAGMRQK